MREDHERNLIILVACCEGLVLILALTAVLVAWFYLAPAS